MLAHPSTPITSLLRPSVIYIIHLPLASLNAIGLPPMRWTITLRCFLVRYKLTARDIDRASICVDLGVRNGYLQSYLWQGENGRQTEVKMTLCCKQQMDSGIKSYWGLRTSQGSGHHILHKEKYFDGRLIMKNICLKVQTWLAILCIIG